MSRFSTRYGERGLREGGWRPVLDGGALALIIIAYFTFFYVKVGFRFIPEFAEPAGIMILMLTAGLFVSYPIARWKPAFGRFNVAMIVAGLFSFVGLVAVEQLINAIVAGSYHVPAGGQGVVVTLSPFWAMMFYFSVGVAEETLFTLLFFGSLVANGLNPLIALILKSALFVTYHNWVAYQLYHTSIFNVPNYAIVLYVGSFLLTAGFYFTRYFVVAALGHGCLNAFVYAYSLHLIHV